MDYHPPAISFCVSRGALHLHPLARAVSRRDQGERFLGRLVHRGVGLPAPNMAADLIESVPLGWVVTQDLLKESWVVGGRREEGEGGKGMGREGRG